MNINHDIVIIESVLSALNGMEKPEGVKGVKCELGHDSFGDAAIWIFVNVENDLKPSKKKLAALCEFAEIYREKLFEQGVERFPLVDYVVA